MDCAVCSNLGAEEIKDQKLSANQRMAKFIQLHDLKRSAKRASCQPCRLLWAVLCLRKDIDETSGEEVSGLLQMRFAPGTPLQLSVSGWGQENIALELFSRREDHGLCHPTIGPAQEVESHSSSPASLTLASTWLQDCLESHPSCRQAATASQLPTRVIDVGTAGLREPHLVESRGASGAYAALSYCWGDPAAHPAFKTTRLNLGAHQEAIPCDSMPPTLRDAVAITRNLGLRYLWIDALCIIQGDAEDWAREAGRMCEVYSNATVTISVDHADGSSVGVFAPQAFGVPPQRLDELGGGAQPVYVRDELKRKHNDITVLLRTIEAEGAHGEPINKRAWTLQEAILSNRTLHYTTNELVWECNTLRSCACRRDQPVELDEESVRCFRSPGLFRTLSSAGRAYLQWRQVVQLFSERSISFDADRLPALSGMAKQFRMMHEEVYGKQGQQHQQQQQQQQQRSRYIAGLWEGDFATQLLWTADDDYWRNPETVSRRPGKWRAPSWSWAAIEGPIMFHPMSHFKGDLEVLDVQVEPLMAEDIYGQVCEDAKIVVRGAVVHGLKITTTQIQNGDSMMGFTEGVRYDLVDAEANRYTMICDYAGSVARGERYSCLLVGKTWNKGDAHPYHGFIVLQRVEPATDMFRRVGVSFRAGALKDTNEVKLFDGAAREVITLI
ncbi:heterokaryon incompatibility protein [Colletotrichum orchidophilum]|uniref:Heterokaryon incompatibility protein n=1 Tax=Colletotrichum orchidophilum TaxID=1209926 RepID=A0A1G4BCJ8_9PEZI|nr:heterokaryon incompatibility protein [Colletotrichum orchidophilum]OHE99076.1 heterokaryon incompatibility protein [Colletotrichum orchidophilum]